MRKAQVLILLFVLLLLLCACAKNEGGQNNPLQNEPGREEPGNTPGSGKPYPNADSDGGINLDKIAHYDREYDYTQNPRYRVAYLTIESGPLYQQSAEAYEHWAPLYNCEWAGFLSAGGDSDLFLTNLQNLIDQGVEGFILDPDASIWPAVVSLLEQYPEVKWMSQMAPPRDGESGEGVPTGGNLLNNYVGFDNYDSGRQQVLRLVQWKKENLPDVPWEEIGFVAMAFSSSPPLQERVMGAVDTWEAETGCTDNIFMADAVSTGINLQGGIDAVGPVISTKDYQYWLVAGLIDDFAQAAASVIDQQGLTDNSCVVVFGGSGLQMQWDAGQQDSFRYALFTAQNLYAEPIIGAVYAYLNGWATPDSIWPSWIMPHDHGKDGHTYSQLRLPTVWLEYETYKHYLEWTDMYANADAYPYSREGINVNDYTPFLEIPEEYKVPCTCEYCSGS